jgi:LPXTG-motif cell wall-anchored protein
MSGLAHFLLFDSPALLAQTGFAKTMLGYVAVGVLIAVGLALMLRPTSREAVDKKKKK